MTRLFVMMLTLILLAYFSSNRNGDFSFSNFSHTPPLKPKKKKKKFNKAHEWGKILFNGASFGLRKFFFRRLLDILYYQNYIYRI